MTNKPASVWITEIDKRVAAMEIKLAEVIAGFEPVEAEKEWHR